jgi:hypothetical protein
MITQQRTPDAPVYSSRAHCMPGLQTLVKLQRCVCRRSLRPHRKVSIAITGQWSRERNLTPGWNPKPFITHIHSQFHSARRFHVEAKKRLAAHPGSRLVIAALVLCLVGVAAGCGTSALATGSHGARKQDSARTSPTGCKNGAGGHSDYDPQSVAPNGKPILVGPIVVGCGSGLDEPVRLIAYVQGTSHNGEQLCVVVEQERQKAATGGPCFQTSPSLDVCRGRCPLIVEDTAARSGDTQRPKGSLVTGAVPGVMKEVNLSIAPSIDNKATRPLIVVLNRAMQKELRIPSAVSFFVSFVEPCISPHQMLYARGRSSGEEFTMHGSDRFGCRA